MNLILLTQSTTPVIGQVAWVLGMIMNGIFYVIDLIGLPNIGLAIILFTIVVNLLMTPLNIKQQKFSKLQAKMSPELQAIEAKYKGRSDQDAMMAKNQEIQMIYAKYGVSATGSCVQLLIQMPILFALYQVIYRMPAYVTKIGNTFKVLADKIISVDGGGFLQDSGAETVKRVVAMYGQSMTNGDLGSGIIDVLNKLSSADLAMVAEHYDLTQLTYQGRLIISNDTTRGLIDVYNNFLGLHMGDKKRHGRGGMGNRHRGCAYSGPVGSYPVDQREADAPAAQERQREGQFHGCFHEDHEHDNASDVRMVLLYPACGHGPVLGGGKRGAQHPAGGHQQAYRQDGL